MTHADRGFLRAPLLGIGVEEDISAAPLTVLVDDQPDLTGLQLGDRPAGREGTKKRRGQVRTGNGKMGEEETEKNRERLKMKAWGITCM